MAALPVAPEHDYACKERDTGHGQEQVLRPWIGTRCPGRETAAQRERLGCVEDGQRHCQQRQDDETASKVDEAEEDLGNAHAKFDSLWK